LFVYFLFSSSQQWKMMKRDVGEKKLEAADEQQGGFFGVFLSQTPPTGTKKILSHSSPRMA
jgi:hypothetical protein